MLQDIKEYDLCDIHNADNTGLFLSVQASKTFSFHGDPCHNRTKIEEQVTVLLACRDKQAPLAICKHRRPCCSKNVKKNYHRLML